VVVGSTQVHLPFVQLTSLAWSPDGTRSVVTAQKTKTASIEVFTVRPDGTEPIQLTTGYNAAARTGAELASRPAGAFAAAVLAVLLAFAEEAGQLGGQALTGRELLGRFHQVDTPLELLDIRSSLGV
jgi:hypothetical protein